MRISPKRVLLVDDEEFFGRPVIEALRKSGYEVQLCNDAGKVIPTALAFDPDVIILDLMMPPPAGVSPEECDEGMTTGLWLIERLRETTSLRAVPIIVLSNYLARNPSVLEAARVDETVMFRSKFDTPPFAVASCVEAALARASECNTPND
jgi:CheY-like chemotaxis protein